MLIWVTFGPSSAPLASLIQKAQKIVFVETRRKKMYFNVHVGPWLIFKDRLRADAF
jgi:hypothetical protein